MKGGKKKGCSSKSVGMGKTEMAKKYEPTKKIEMNKKKKYQEFKGSK